LRNHPASLNLKLAAGLADANFSNQMKTVLRNQFRTSKFEIQPHPHPAWSRSSEGPRFLIKSAQS
jgi:hypothetical protein